LTFHTEDADKPALTWKKEEKKEKLKKKRKKLIASSSLLSLSACGTCLQDISKQKGQS